MSDDYKELTDKIGRVEITMTEKLGEVLASVRELGAEMRNAVNQVRDMRVDVERVKDMATRAKDSTDSAHKRLDELKPIKEANLVKRVENIESTIKWVSTTVIGAVILAVLGLVFVKSKGG
jgi:CHASE3 domain sensor protein